MTDKSMPLVSILMPTLNAMPYLVEAMESVLNQNYRNWELVIVNDKSSTDGTNEYLAQLSDRRIKVVQCENGNISAALNIGIEMCEGKYIARMDADNIMTPDRLEKQVAYMESNPEVGLSGGTCQGFGNHTYLWQPPVDPDDIFAMLLFFLPFSHSVFMFRKESLGEIRYNESQLSEGYEIMTRLAFQTRIGAVKDDLLFFRWHDAQNTMSVGERAKTDAVATTKKFYRQLGLKDISADVLSQYGKLWEDATESNMDEKMALLIYELGKLYVQLLEKKIFSGKALRKAIKKRWNDPFLPPNLQEKFDSLKESKYNDLLNIMFENERMNLNIKKCDDPVISVIMPTYNVNATLYLSLMTLRGQNYKEFEIIIVNDGSQNILNYILLFVNDDRIRILQNEEHLGIAKSLNRGIRESKAKYIARADADDWYHPERFSKQVKFLDNHHEISLVSTWQYTLYNNKMILELLPKKHEDIKAKLFFYCCISHTSCMWRREDFLKHNLFYDPDYEIEDYELWNRAVHVLKFHCIEEPLVYYRSREVVKDSRSANLELEEIDLGFQRIFRKNFARMDIAIDDSESWLLKSWFKPFEQDDPLLPLKIARLREVLLQLLENNKTIKLYNQKKLTRVVQSRWEDATSHLPHQTGYRLGRLYDGPRLMHASWVRKILFACKKRFKKIWIPVSSAANRGIERVSTRTANKLMYTSEYFLHHRITPHMKQELKELTKKLLHKGIDRFDIADGEIFEKAIEYKAKLKEVAKSESGDELKRKIKEIIQSGGRAYNVSEADSCKVQVVDTRLDQARSQGMDVYLSTHDVKKLQINSADNALDGWLNTDLSPRENKGIYRLDLLKKFPFEDGTFDYIYSEHGMEHFKIEECETILKECRRVLKKGGKMRISTPDLKKMINFYLTDSKETEIYRRIHQDVWVPHSKSIGLSSKALVLNNFFRDWGHQVIYDEESFRYLLNYCGFGNIIRVEVGKSNVPSFQNIERHERNSHEIDISEFESMIFECEKV